MLPTLTHGVSVDEMAEDVVHGDHGYGMDGHGYGMSVQGWIDGQSRTDRPGGMYGQGRGC